jgi:hypothetical protein
MALTRQIVNVNPTSEPGLYLRLFITPDRTIKRRWASAQMKLQDALQGDLPE